MPGSPQARTQVVERSAVARKLSCSFQDRSHPAPPAKPWPQNALDLKLSCSFQERPSAAFGPAPSAAGGCASPPLDVSRDTLAGSSGGPHATSSGSRAPLGDTPHRLTASAGDTLGAAVAGTPPDYRSLVGDDTARQ